MDHVSALLPMLVLWRLRAQMYSTDNNCFGNCSSGHTLHRMVPKTLVILLVDSFADHGKSSIYFTLAHKHLD